MGQKYGPARVTVARNWQTMLVRTQNKPEQQQILIVNDFFARNLRYQTDIQLWKQNDYWATPLETLGRGLGDCEDYAIAKYISLRALGVSDDKLRLIYVKAKLAGTNKTQAHETSTRNRNRNRNRNRPRLVHNSPTASAHFAAVS